MSYDQTFKGAFHYADDHCIEAALDAFVAAGDDCIVELDDLKLDGFTISVAMDCSAPASSYDSTRVALDALGAFAERGSIQTSFRLDGVSYDQVGCSGRRSAHGLPDRHRRWDVFRAAVAGSAASLRALQAAGVALDQTYPALRGWSALHLAARAGAADAVAVLLAAGVAVDAEPWPGGPTPLAVATTGDVARVLLAAGARPDRELRDGSLVVLACLEGRHEVVLELLAAGATVPESDREGVACACARRGALATLLALVDHDPGFAATLCAHQVMAAAIEGGDAVLVDLLLDHGASLPDSFLVDAVRARSVPLVQWALRAPDAIARGGPVSDHDSPMCRAAHNGDLAMMQLLAAHGSPLHPDTPGQTTPMHRAAVSSGGDAEACVRWLLDHGVPINPTDGAGESVVYLTSLIGTVEMLAFLVGHGADAAEVTHEMLGAEAYERFLAITGLEESA